MKIKTMEFWVSNSQLVNREFDLSRYQEKYDNNVISFEDIDREVNGFIVNVNVIDIKINDLTILRHNNAGSDFIKRTYTIIYNE